MTLAELPGATLPLTAREHQRRYSLLVLLCVLLSLLLGLGLAQWHAVAMAGVASRGVEDVALTATIEGPLTNLLPGDERQGSIVVTNSGPTDVTYAIAARSTVRDPFLAAAMELDLWVAMDGSCALSGGAAIYSGPLQAFTMARDALTAPGGENSLLCLTIRVPRPVGNAYQGAAGDVTFLVIP